MFCVKCGKPNDDASTFCASCGAALAVAGPDGVPMAPHATASAELGLYQAAIGLKRQAYYLRRFLAFDAQGKAGAAWHWPAFFVTLYWLLYRKMWGSALLYFLLPYAFAILVGLGMGFGGAQSPGAVAIVSGVYLLTVFLLPPMYANALYYRHSKKKIAAARAASPHEQHQLGEVSARGGTSGMLVLAIMLLTSVPFIGVMAAVAIPAYQDYTTRAHITRAVDTAQAGSAAITRYWRAHQVMPASLAEAGLDVPTLPGMQAFRIDSASGTLSVVMTAPAVAGKTLLMVPAQDGERELTWTCRSPDIRDALLPAQCRRVR